MSALCSLLLLSAACLDKPENDTGKATLYVFDGRTHDVLSWDDISAIYDAGDADAADRSISSGKLTSLTLGWAGMALDSYNQYLYLVSTGGTVVRIGRIDQQNGSVSSADIISFTLDDSETAISSGIFGQAAVNPVGSVLYVTETSTSGDKTQVWAIPAALMGDGVTIDESTGGIIIGKTSDTGDGNGTGVAASSSAVYAYFDTGGSIQSGGTDYSASRLRKGSLSGFPTASNVIVGVSGNGTTLLGKYGCLAYDTGNDRLYVARHNTDSGTSGNPLVAFTPGQFSPGFEVAPERPYQGPSSLRVIAHAGQKDWLAGGLLDASNTLWIWKGPSSEDASLSVALPDTGSGSIQIHGLALDGSD